MFQPNFILIFIIPSILFSPILSLSMNSWFLIWMTLEFNLMAFIPFIMFFNKYYKNLTIKYFIIQAFSSSILIFCSNFQLIFYNEFWNLINILMNLSILMKIGASPFHSWFINMMNNLNWLNCLILATWQKIIPMILLMYLYNFKIIYISAILSCLISAMLGLNHQSIRIIMSYSSINHLGWMLITLLISENLWNLYFISYFLMNFSIMMIFNKFKIFSINQLFIFYKFKFYKIIMLFNFLSISGLPPMFGFMMKWFSLFFFNWNNNFFMILIMIILSILTFTFYIRITFSFLIQFNLIHKLSLINKLNFNKFNLINILVMNIFLNIWILSIWLM